MIQTAAAPEKMERRRRDYSDITCRVRKPLCGLFEKEADILARRISSSDQELLVAY
jgi:hypothetical protein